MEFKPTQRPFNCCRAGTDGQRNCPRYWVMQAGCPPGSPYGFMENGILLPFDRVLSQSEGANAWQYSRFFGPFGQFVRGRVIKPNLSKDATIFCNCFSGGFGGLEGTEMVSQLERLPWEFHFAFPLEKELGTEDVEWLPDGMNIFGFENVSSAVKAWPDLDTTMVDL